MTPNSEIAMHEIVLTKRSSYFVPSLCPGCGGHVEVARKLAHSTWMGLIRGGGLALRVGFCRPCSDAYTRRGQPAWWIALAACAIATMACGAMIAAPPLPPAVIIAVPCFATALVIWLLERRWSRGQAASRRAGSPYRTPSMQPATTPPGVPLQLRYGGRSRALLHCASAAWALDFALVNKLELRALPTPPRLPFLGFAGGTGMVVAALCGVGAWHFQWPVLLLDNPGSEPVTIFLDGAPRWHVPPLGEHEAPMEVRIARGRHRITHRLDSASTPESDLEVVAEGLKTTDRKLYDPLGSGCYQRYPVVYGGGGARKAGFLPPARLVEPKADHLFTEAPKSVWLEKGRSDVRWVVERDVLCLEKIANGCSPQTTSELRDCVIRSRNDDEHLGCYLNAPEACRPQDATGRPAEGDG